MFAEELSGNASRKRQQENRARRRQLKNEKQKKAVATAKATTTTTTLGSAPAAVAGTVSTTPAVSTNGTAASATAAATKPAAPTAIPSLGTTTTVPTNNGLDTSIDGVSSGSGGGKPAAVAAALQQRQMRQASQLQQKSSIKIQSLVRAYLSNKKLLEYHSNSLTKVLSDLNKLRILLLQKNPDSPYVPPPATGTALVRQLLFITREIPFQRKAASGKEGKIQIRSRDDMKKLHDVLEFTILPGLAGSKSDDNSNPFLAWLQSREGKWRLENLIRLCLHVSTTKNVSIQCVGTICTMLRVLLGVVDVHEKKPVSSSNQMQETIIPQCQKWLIQSTTTNPPTTKEGQGNAAKPTMDLLQTLRKFLLFTIGGSQPIPPTSIALREECISKQERAHADLLFQLVLDVIIQIPEQQRRQLQSRFVAEIISIPLITWKISAASTAKMLTKPGGGHNILLVELITSFTSINAIPISQGKIATVLPELDVPLTQCPATNTQCLLANMLAIGRLSANLNGSDRSKINYEDATILFRLVATLLDAVPLGTFVSRDSAVAWVTDGKGTHTPIVLSPVILDQCKLLLVDSFVRNLVNCAIDSSALNVDVILETKNEKDLKHETDLKEAAGAAGASASAASLAAKDARNDKGRAWLASKWARGLKSGVSTLLKSAKGGADVGGEVVHQQKRFSSSGSNGKGMLLETSSVSMQLAKGDRKPSAQLEKAPSIRADASSSMSSPLSTYSPVLLFALCRVYAIVLARWGGAGEMDVVAGHSVGGKEELATSRPDPCSLALLNVLCFGTDMIRTIWALIQSDKVIISDLYAISEKPKGGQQSMRALTARPSHILAKDADGAVLFYVFVAVLSHTLIITDDAEIHEMGRPLPLHQTRRVIQLLKKVVCRACNEDGTTTVNEGKDPFGLALVSTSVKVMKSLYDRSARRPLCVPKMWLIDNLLVKEIQACKSHSDYVSLLSTPVLRICPFLLAFKRRLKLFERIVTTSRIEIQGVNDINPFNSNPLKPGIPVQIMRGRVLEDGLATLNKLGPNLRERINVQYVNQAGVRESGVDAGGLFKEFWTDLCAIAFDPNYALFRVTEDVQNCLYPNPSSGAAHGAETHIILFEFLGRILGKALFEGITVHPQFSHFFLSFLRGDYNYLHMLPDLSSVDAQLYNNLMFLKTYDGDAEDLCLSFTVANDDFGGNKQIELVPNGSNIEVTNANKQRYIGLVAKHYVVDRVKVQSEAFTRGLWDVIDKSWLRLFNEPELQVLISGATGGALDVDDMRANTRYIGGYTGIESSIRRFWSVVASLSTKQQADLLRFVTSCERPPPLGFASMNPPFTIQRVGIMRDGDRLPTASTCFNTLKLPTYSSEKVMKQRLLFAIESGAGFELT